MAERKTLGWKVMVYLANVISASLGGGIIVGFIVVSSWGIFQRFTHHNRNEVLFQPGFPLQVLCSIPLGYINAKMWKSHWIYFSWIGPAAFFIFYALSWHPPSVFAGYWQQFASHFFGRNCTERDCFDRFLALPLLTSLGYTVGVWLERFKIFVSSQGGSGPIEE